MNKKERARKPDHIRKVTDIARATGESGVWYGLSRRKTGMNVTHPYRAVQTQTHDSTNLKIVRSTFRRNTTRPAKNRNRETCSSVGNASTANGRRHLSTPAKKNVRIRARLCRLTVCRL